MICYFGTFYNMNEVYLLLAYNVKLGGVNRTSKISTHLVFVRSPVICCEWHVTRGRSLGLSDSVTVKRGGGPHLLGLFQL